MRALLNVGMWATIALGAVGLYLCFKLFVLLGELGLWQRILP